LFFDKATAAKAQVSSSELQLPDGLEHKQPKLILYCKQLSKIVAFQPTSTLICSVLVAFISEAHIVESQRCINKMNGIPGYFVAHTINNKFSFFLPG
jgi:hypothetical protein